jgi:hypothetical protein
MPTKLRNSVVRNFNDLTLLLRQWSATLNADLRWLGPAKLDPESPQDAELWIREDIPSLRIHLSGKTYEVALTEVVKPTEGAEV